LVLLSTIAEDFSVLMERVMREEVEERAEAQGVAMALLLLLELPERLLEVATKAAAAVMPMCRTVGALFGCVCACVVSGLSSEQA
jgi:hypothetical protein